MRKPEFSFELCYASTIVNSPTIFDITKLNKVFKHIKSEKSYIKFPSLNIDSLNSRIYTDTSFNNFTNGGSQEGQITFVRQWKPELSIGIELIKNKMCSLITYKLYLWPMGVTCLSSPHKSLTISSSNIISTT